MIVVIPQTDPLCNSGEEPDWEWLPAHCPACQGAAIIGHGRRSKPAHAPNRTRIRIRRALCKQCDKTCTILPAWSLPYTHYSLETRQQSWHGYGNGKSFAETAPVLQDADRNPDESTVRRWCWRRMEALANWLVWARAWLALIWRRTPTILAWDFRAAVRILIPEAKRDEIPQNGP